MTDFHQIAQEMTAAARAKRQRAAEKKAEKEAVLAAIRAARGIQLPPWPPELVLERLEHWYEQLQARPDDRWAYDGFRIWYEEALRRGLLDEDESPEGE